MKATRRYDLQRSELYSRALQGEPFTVEERHFEALQGSATDWAAETGRYWDESAQCNYIECALVGLAWGRLAADNAISLEASKNTWTQQSTNSSSGTSIGVGFATGAQNGFTIELGVSQGRGTGNGSDVSYNNTQVSGGQGVNVQSGGDLNIRGGVVAAPTVTADVGGNLNIENLQNTSEQVSKQNSAGLNASLCIPPIYYGVSTVGGSVANAKADGSYASVAEQSGIKAGDGGFDVNVKGNTDLKGGVISSTQVAVDNKSNGFQTASLTTSDIENHSTYSASGYIRRNQCI